MKPVIISNREPLEGRQCGLIGIVVVEKPFPLIQKIKDTIFSRFAIYSNPVQKGASFKINAKDEPKCTSS